METRIKKDTVKDNLKKYYQQRAQRLRKLKLDDITRNVTTILWSPESETADKIVTHLIEMYLAQFEDWWRKALKKKDFCLEALNIKSKNNRQRYAYEDQLAYARNRLTLAFINQYCTANYEIDWRKIIVFNSRKKLFTAH
ncbi:MAG: hypothetical protein HY070_07720 [Chloroflexi bacterium]|nr:hypothetical protein [Chloroflexota bacterium]